LNQIASGYHGQNEAIKDGHSQDPADDL